MSAKAIFTKAGTLLRNRLLRNIVLWVLILFLSLGMNLEADNLHHYGFRGSAWYWRVLMGCLVLQLISVYVNNLVLVPKLLFCRRRMAYAVSLFLLLLSISICYIIGLKIAAAHIDVSKMEMIFLPTDLITPSWSLQAVAEEIRSCFVGNLIWVSFFTMAWYVNDYARQRKDSELARQEQRETELSFLNSQLAPHFLFNTLNNIYALTLRESAAAPEAMLKLAAILRSLLYESGAALVPFEKEKELIQAYTDLELLRLKNGVLMNFDVRADRDYKVPPLLWLPLLENIFKHGTRIISDELFIQFSFVIENNILVISGRNYCKETVEQRGIGLQNLRRRLKLLYPDAHTFYAGFSDHVFTTKVTVNLR